MSNTEDARAELSCRLAVYSAREIDHAIGDDNICRVVRDRKVFDLAQTKFDVLITAVAAFLLEVLQLCTSGRIRWADMLLAPSISGLCKWRQCEPDLR